MSFVSHQVRGARALRRADCRCRLVPAAARPRASRGCSLPASDRLLCRCDGGGGRALGKPQPEPCFCRRKQASCPGRDGLFSSHQRQVHRGASSTSIIAFLDERCATGTDEFRHVARVAANQHKAYLTAGRNRHALRRHLRGQARRLDLRAETRPAHLDYLKTQDSILPRGRPLPRRLRTA